MPTLTRTFLITLATLAAVGTVFRFAPTPSTAAPPTPPDNSYYYRQIVRLKHAGEIYEMNVVAACNTKLAAKFGSGASFAGPRLYVERVANNHAIGFRVTHGCGRSTTENGGAPPDLLPHVLWFDDADDLTQGILYATEDAYTNQLSQLQFLGSTIHQASAEEFAAFLETKRQKSLVPIDGTDRAANGVGARPNLDELLAIGRASKPNNHVGMWNDGNCEGMFRNELNEAGRAAIRTFWPPSTPKYWTHDESKTYGQVDGNGKRVPNGPMAALHALPAKTKQYPEGGSTTDGGAVHDGGWQVYLPNVDGLPTRAGGGQLRPGLIPKPRVRDIFPIAATVKLHMYRRQDQGTTPLKWNIDMRGGDTKGFVYCSPFLSNLRGSKPPNDFLETLLPGYHQRTVEIKIDGVAVDLSGAPTSRQYKGSTLDLPIIFEEDKAVWTMMYYR
jgi:hypothetical protein